MRKWICRFIIWGLTAFVGSQMTPAYNFTSSIFGIPEDWLLRKILGAEWQTTISHFIEKYYENFSPEYANTLVAFLGVSLIVVVFLWQVISIRREYYPKIQKPEEIISLDVIFDPSDSSCIVNKLDFINRRPSGEVMYGPPIIHKEYRIKIHNPSLDRDAHKVTARLERITPYDHAYNEARLLFLHDRTEDGSDSHNGITIPADGNDYIKIAGVSDYDEFGNEQIRIYFADPIPQLIDASHGYELCLLVRGEGFTPSRKRFFVQRNPETHEPEFWEVTKSTP